MNDTAIINADMYSAGKRSHTSPPQFAFQYDFVYAKENHSENVTERNAKRSGMWVTLVLRSSGSCSSSHDDAELRS